MPLVACIRGVQTTTSLVGLTYSPPILDSYKESVRWLVSGLISPAGAGLL